MAALTETARLPGRMRINRLNVPAAVAQAPMGLGPLPVSNGQSPVSTWPSVSGTFHDATGAPGRRLIHAYSRSTGRLVASTYSDTSTGAYLLRIPPGTGEVKVTVQDDDAGELRNDLILRVIPA